MKIEINIAKLTDSPYSSDLKDSFLIEDSGLVDNLVKELNNAHSSTFLVSGYRGAGKTSFINQVIEKMGKDTIHVDLSLAKYDSYSDLVKKLIRQLHISFENSNRKDEKILIDIRDRLKQLYDQTFHEITRYKKNDLINENATSSEVSFDLKKIAPLIFVGLSGSIGMFNLFKSTFASYSLFLLSLIWTVISSWNLTHKKSNNNTQTDSYSKKNLYDNEIAEHYLFEIIKELKRLNVKTLIVFDELDKIQPIGNIYNIINELKSLLLSGYSNFIVIAGQGLYYQLEKSETEDDSILSSIFSKSIHIPFLKYTTLKKYCLRLVKDDAINRDELSNNFFDSLILNSGRNPRKLSNLIRAKLNWDDKTPYLLVEESQDEIYKLESQLLSITTKILDSELPKFTNNIIKQDFFIAQIHLWINTIKQYRSNLRTFTIEEIIKKESYNVNEYLPSYIDALFSVCGFLFDKLVEENVLVKDGQNFNVHYYWRVIEEFPEQEIFDNKVIGGEEEEEEEIFFEKKNSSGSIDPDFINEYIEMESYVRSIYIDLVDEATISNSNLSIKQMLNTLIETGIFTKEWYSSTKIDNIINTRNKVVHGMKIETEDLNIIQNSRFDLGRLKAELIEDYTYYITKRHLDKYNVQKENKGGFDFIAKKENESIVFEVKYLQYGKPDPRNINEIIDKFTNYLQMFPVNSFYVLFFYQPNGRKSYDEFYSNFFDIIRNKLPDLSERFFLYYNSEYRGDANSARLETYLDQIQNKIIAINKVNSKNGLINNVNLSEFEDIQIKTKIRQKAESEWPGDYGMQLHEINKQEDAINTLKKGKPEDISEAHYKVIREKAKNEWPNDYEMRVHEEQKQFDAIRKLN